VVSTGSQFSDQKLFQGLAFVRTRADEEMLIERASIRPVSGNPICHIRT
jgi:hypothetical protein